METWFAKKFVNGGVTNFRVWILSTLSRKLLFDCIVTIQDMLSIRKGFTSGDYYSGII